MKLKYKMLIFLLPLIIIPVIITAIIFINKTSSDAIRLHEEIMQMTLDTMIAKITEEHSVLELVGVEESDYYRASVQTRTINYIAKIESVDAFVHIYDFEGNVIYNSEGGPSRNFYSELPGELVDYESLDETYAKFEGSLSGEEHIGYFVDFTPWEWRVVILSKESAILSAVTNAIEQSMIVLAIVAIVVVCVFIVLSKNITAPLKKLTDAAKIIGSGDFNKRIHVNTNDEFHDLANSYNEMAEQLLEYFSKLDAVKIKLETQNSLLNEEIIERKKIQRELIESEEKFRVIFNNAFHFIALLDSDGHLLEVNNTAVEATNSTYNEVIGELFWDTNLMGTSHESKKGMKSAIKNASQGKFIHENTVLEFDEGEPIHLNYTITPITDNSGEVTLLIPEGLDISELVKKENELIKLNHELESRVNERTSELRKTNLDLTSSLSETERARAELMEIKDELELSLESLHSTQDQLVESRKMAALGSLVIGISHEINTPVGVSTTSATYLSVLLNELNDSIKDNSLTKSLLSQNIQKSQESIKIILESIEKIANLVSDFKLISVNEDNVAIKNFNLCEYLNNIIPICTFKLMDSNHVLNLKCEDDIELYNYPDALTQVFSYLIDNSITHGFENKSVGIIDITVTDYENSVFIDYRDNGKGMSQNEVEKIFEPFFTTKLGTGHSGLGMNITYNLVTVVMRGSITVESSIDKGVSINLTLPKNLNDYPK